MEAFGIEIQIKMALYHRALFSEISTSTKSETRVTLKTNRLPHTKHRNIPLLHNNLRKSAVVSICSVRVWCKQQIVSNLHTSVWIESTFSETCVHNMIPATNEGCCVWECVACTLGETVHRRIGALISSTPSLLTRWRFCSILKPKAAAAATTAASTVFPGNPDPGDTCYSDSYSGSAKLYQKNIAGSGSSRDKRLETSEFLLAYPTKSVLFIFKT